MYYDGRMLVVAADSSKDKQGTQAIDERLMMMMLPCVLVAAHVHNKSFHGGRVDVVASILQAQKRAFAQYQSLRCCLLIYMLDAVLM